MKNSKLQVLASLGYSIIPCLEDKRPMGKWGDYQTKHRTIEEVSNLDAPLYGIITGYNYLECLDVDLKVFSTAKEQMEWWNEFIDFLEDNILDFKDKFVIKKTKNNGFHILFKTKRVDKNNKIAKLKGHKEAILETRGIGGFIVAYEDSYNKLDYKDINFVSDEDREILFQVAKTYDYVEPIIENVSTKAKYEPIEGEITPWDDFNQKNKVWDIIQDEFKIVRDLPNKYIIKRFGATSVHSGYIYKDNDLMYLHSTGTQYEAETQYSAYSAYVQKNFQGDYSAATRQLYNDGYGSRRVKKENEPKEIININKDDLIFPIDIFPGNIQAYITQCAETLNSNIDYMGSSLLWLISLCIGNSIKIEVKKGWREGSTIWIAVVGKAGIGKTPSISNIIFPLETQNNKEIRNYIKEREKFEHYDNLSAKEKQEYPEVQNPRKKQFIANDITLEALVALHEENDNGVGVFKDELAGWFKDMNKYKQGSDLEFWLSTWSGKSVNLNRVSRAGSFVAKPLIPVLGGIQPGIFSSFYTEENKDNGFMDRILLSYPDAKVEEYNDNEMDYSTIQWYSDRIVNFYEVIKNRELKRDEHGNIEPHILKFGSEAKKEWIRIFNEITKTQNSDEENEYMKSMLPKQKSYIPRFALLIHVFNGLGVNDYNVGEVSKESILKAEKLSKYFVAMAKKIKVDSKEANEIKTIVTLNKNKTTKEKFIALYEANPNLNKKEVAEQLGITRQTIYNYIKECQK